MASACWKKKLRVAQMGIKKSNMGVRKKKRFQNYGKILQSIEKGKISSPSIRFLKHISGLPEISSPPLSKVKRLTPNIYFDKLVGELK